MFNTWKKVYSLLLPPTKIKATTGLLDY